MRGGEDLNLLPLFSPIARADLGISHRWDPTTDTAPTAAREVASCGGFNNNYANSLDKNQWSHLRLDHTLWTRMRRGLIEGVGSKLLLQG